MNVGTVYWYLKYSVQISGEGELALYILKIICLWDIQICGSKRQIFENWLCIQIVYMGINLRKHWEEWRSENGKRSKLINRMLLASYLSSIIRVLSHLGGSDGRPCRTCLRVVTPEGQGCWGIYPLPALYLVEASSSNLAHHTCGLTFLQDCSMLLPTNSPLRQRVTDPGRKKKISKGI